MVETNPLSVTMTRAWQNDTNITRLKLCGHVSKQGMGRFIEGNFRLPSWRTPWCVELATGKLLIEFMAFEFVLQMLARTDSKYHIYIHRHQRPAFTCWIKYSKLWNSTCLQFFFKTVQSNFFVLMAWWHWNNGNASWFGLSQNCRASRAIGVHGGPHLILSCRRL